MRSIYDFSTFRSLRHRNFRLLVEGNVISTSGDFMQSIAQSWLVWQLTHSPFLLGLVSFFDTVPRLFLGAIGGAISDRFDRRRVLIITQSLAMVQAIVYCFAVYFKVILFWHIAVLAFFLGCIDTINQTVRQSLVNGMVPKEELLNAIGLQSSFFNLSKILGPSVGGAIIAFLGISGCFFLNALSFVALIWNLYLMKLPRWEAPTHKQGVWKEIKEGYGYLRNNRRIFSIVSLSYIVALVGAPYSRFIPMFATNTHVDQPVRASNVPGSWRHRFGFVPRLHAELSPGDFLDLLLRDRLRPFPRLIYLLTLLFLVLGVPGSGWRLPSRRSRRFEYRDSSGNAAAFARPSSESVLHGHRIMVAWRARDRQRCRDHRHRPHASSVRRHMYHRGHRTAVSVKPKSPKITSSNLAQDVVRT
jgi:MFS family permease